MDAEDNAEKKARLFAGETASSYARFRRAYPPELVARLADIGRGGGGRLLDLGCGTGTLLLQLAPFFARTVGVDPEPDMLREAKQAAREQGLENVEWIEGSSSDLQTLAAALGEFDLVTIRTAFHFMEPTATLTALQRIAPGGAVAVAYNGTPMWLHPDPWAKALRRVLENRLGQLGDSDFTTEALLVAEDTMNALAYTQIERWERSWIGLDFVIGHILSATSADQIPPAQREDFAREVSSALTPLAPAGHVDERVRASAP